MSCSVTAAAGEREKAAVVSKQQRGKQIALFTGHFLTEREADGDSSTCTSMRYPTQLTEKNRINIYL